MVKKKFKAELPRKRGNPRPLVLTEYIFTRMSKDMKKEFKGYALEEGLSVSDLSRSLVSQYLVKRRIDRMKIKQREA